MESTPRKRTAGRLTTKVALLEWLSSLGPLNRRPENVFVVPVVLADLEHRARTPQAAVEAKPVAWRYRWREANWLPGSWSDWAFLTKEPQEINQHAYELEPLYASPPQDLEAARQEGISFAADAVLKLANWDETTRWVSMAGADLNKERNRVLRDAAVWLRGLATASPFPREGGHE